jgi:hypothetical protein
MDRWTAAADQPHMRWVESSSRRAFERWGYVWGDVSGYVWGYLTRCNPVRSSLPKIRSQFAGSRPLTCRGDVRGYPLIAAFRAMEHFHICGGGAPW